MTDTPSEAGKPAPQFPKVRALREPQGPSTQPPDAAAPEALVRLVSLVMSNADRLIDELNAAPPTDTDWECLIERERVLLTVGAIGMYAEAALSIAKGQDERRDASHWLLPPDLGCELRELTRARDCT